MKWLLVLISRVSTKKNRFLSDKESVHELANWISHVLGIVFIIPAGTYLLFKSWQTQTWKGFTAVLVFVLGFLLLYVASSVYHYMYNNAKRDQYRKFDHISIFIMIAGTYTPFLVIYLDNFIGKLYLSILWILVLLGSIYKLYLMGRYRWISLFLYLFMGWILVFNFKMFSHALPTLSLQWIFIGGLFYTLGVVFYVWKKLPFNHFIWHLFVLGGSLSHFIAVYYCIA
nr:hemolysin III family protein [uncultured Marinifilum sp.]